MRIRKSIPIEIVIIAAGEGLRFLGDGPKHLVRIGGEALLQRTIRLLLPFENAIKIVVPPLDPRYDFLLQEGVVLVERAGEAESNSRKYIEALHASDNSDVLIVLGDVFFTKKATELIYERSAAANEILFFCRYSSTPLINSGWPEIFAVFVPREQRDRFEESAANVQRLHRKGEIWRDSGWEISKHLSGMNTNLAFRNQPYLSNYVSISDLTDDVDYLSDLERFRRLIPDESTDIKEELISLLSEVSRLFEKYGGQLEVGRRSKGWHKGEHNFYWTNVPPVTHLERLIDQKLATELSLNKAPDTIWSMYSSARIKILPIAKRMKHILLSVFRN